MKLYKEKLDETITPIEMRNGQIAIVERCLDGRHVGKIVQRYNETLFMLGEDDAWTGSIPRHDEFRVRILPKGTLLEI